MKQEDKWLDFDDDEIEVSLELSEFVFEVLLTDTISSYVDMSVKRKDLRKAIK